MMKKKLENFLIMLEIKILLSDKGTLVNRVLMVQRYLITKLYEVIK